MALPKDGRCINCREKLSLDGWCILQMEHKSGDDIFHVCSLLCSLSVARRNTFAGGRSSKVHHVNEVTYNPLNFLRVSPFEILLD